MSSAAQSFLWQEMRDSAKWEYESAQNAQERQRIYDEQRKGKWWSRFLKECVE